MIDVDLIESGLEMRLGRSGFAFFQIPAFCVFVQTLRLNQLRNRPSDCPRSTLGSSAVTLSPALRH
jgi:hypothetical protein